MLKLIRAATVPESLETFCNGFLKELSSDYEVIALSSQGKDLELIAKREGVRTIAVNMQRHISPLKDFISLIKLIRVFLKEKPDIIHSMTPKAGLLCMIASKIAGVPVRIHTFTGLVFPTSVGIKQKILMLTDKITCFCATHIIPEGNGVKNDLLNYGITKKPLQVLGYGNVRGIDLDYYCRDEKIKERAAEIRKGKEDKFLFVFVGRLVRDKGINELIEAFVKLNDKYRDTGLLLIGRYEEELDPLKEDTKQNIDNNNSIYFVGEQKDVRPWYACSDVLVFPSYREGFPNVVIEAGALDLPAIVTDINGSNEIIKEGENGTVVPARDAVALYEAMERFYKDRETLRKMSEKARQMIAGRYEQSFVRNCLKEYYKEVSDKRLS